MGFTFAFMLQRYDLWMEGRQEGGSRETTTIIIAWFQERIDSVDLIYWAAEYTLNMVLQYSIPWGIFG